MSDQKVRKIVFENLIESDTGKPVEVEVIVRDAQRREGDAAGRLFCPKNQEELLQRAEQAGNEFLKRFGRT